MSVKNRIATNAGYRNWEDMVLSCTTENPLPISTLVFANREESDQFNAAVLAAGLTKIYLDDGSVQLLRRGDSD